LYATVAEAKKFCGNVAPDPLALSASATELADKVATIAIAMATIGFLNFCIDVLLLK